MRFCNQGHYITTGEPLFCNFCGRSYGLKLCPHRHSNPRTALVCHTCGSRDLSTPHPRGSFWLNTLLFLASALPGIVLVSISILLLFAVVRVLLTDQQLLFGFMMLGMLVAFCWWLYMQLPGFLRAILSRLFRRRRNHHDH